MIPDPSFQDLFPASFVAQEKDVEEAQGVAGGVVPPPNRDDEGRMVGEFSHRGRCLDSPSPFL